MVASRNWRSEGELWEYLSKSLRGKWTRLEVSYPAGLCDSMGLWRGQTIWLEHKVGKPDIKLLLPAQIDFANDCMRHHVPWWCCFGYQREVLFFPTLDFSRYPVTPEFWVSPKEVWQSVKRQREAAARSSGASSPRSSSASAAAHRPAPASGTGNS